SCARVPAAPPQPDPPGRRRFGLARPESRRQTSGARRRGEHCHAMRSTIMATPSIIRIGTLAAVALVACAAAASNGRRWSAQEVQTIRSLWIGELEPPPADPSNRYADDPAAVALGHQLFFDTRLSSN